MWDYVIVGAGSAGCAAASRLAADGRQRVLILEAGETDRHPAIRFPAALAYSEALTRRFDWGYRSAPDPSRRGAIDEWFRGRVVGGSSSINGMLYVRGSAADYDRWRSLGNEGWAAQDVMPVFEGFERTNLVRPGRGTRGSLHVRTIRQVHPLTRAFMEAAVGLGVPMNEDYNGTCQEGIAYAELTQHRWLRCSAADAFLKPVLRQKNTQLVTHAQVQRLRVSGSRVLSVVYERAGVAQSVEARRVILCAGTINTPKLLMLSGIGPAEELRQYGLDPVLHLSQVGKNLREHPLVKLTYRMNCATQNPTGELGQKLRFLWHYLFRVGGPLATAFEAMGFLRTDRALPQPDVQVHFSPVGMANVADNTEVVLRYPAVSVLLNKSYPQSRGEVRLASADPNQAPIIEGRLLSDERDLDTLVQGIEMVRRIMANQPIASFVEHEVRPGGSCRTIRDLEEYVIGNTELGYHPVGTCRMGVDSQAVVGPDLRVRGLENLWIADASIMPDAISGNTNAACMMIGAKLGQQLVADSE